MDDYNIEKRRNQDEQIDLESLPVFRSDYNAISRGANVGRQQLLPDKAVKGAATVLDALTEEDELAIDLFKEKVRDLDERALQQIDGLEEVL